MKETYSHIFQRERRDPGFILEFRNIKQKSSLLSVFTKVFYFFLRLNHALLLSFLCKESRENLVEKERETTRTTNINILFLRPCIQTTSTSKA